MRLFRLAYSLLFVACSTQGESGGETGGMTTPSSTSEECQAGGEGCLCVEGLCLGELICAGDVCVKGAPTTGSPDATTSSGTQTNSTGEDPTSGSATTGEDSDNDGDGFPAPVDCDDKDPLAFPLTDGATLNVHSSITICPGTYKDVQIVAELLTNATIMATGVVLDESGLVAPLDPPDVVNLNLVTFRECHDVIVSGLEIHSYHDRTAAIMIDQSTGVRIEGVYIHGMVDEGGNANTKGIVITGTSASTVEDSELSGFFAGSAIISTDEFSSSIFLNRLQLKDEADVSHGLGNLVTLHGVGHFLQDVTMTDSHGSFCGVFLGGSDHVISGGSVTKVENGLCINADDSSMSGMVISYGSVGVAVFPGVTGNKVTGNDLRFNKDACYKLLGPAPGNTISNNQCDK